MHTLAQVTFSSNGPGSGPTMSPFPAAGILSFACVWIVIYLTILGITLWLAFRFVRAMENIAASSDRLASAVERMEHKRTV